MNKNSKNRRMQMGKMKKKVISFDFEVPKTLPGGNLGMRKLILFAQSQPRKSEKAKVAQTPSNDGLTLIEQGKLFYGNCCKS